jgi:transposase
MGRQKVYRVELSEEQQKRLETLGNKGINKARVIKRGQILLMAHHARSDEAIGEALNISVQTVKSIRKKFAKGGLEAALYDAARPGRPYKFDGKDRAAITSLACSKAPKGYAKWSVRLIADKAVELNIVEGIAWSTVHYILKKPVTTASKAAVVHRQAKRKLLV